jgi:hypothetical protein
LQPARSRIIAASCDERMNYCRILARARGVR